MDFGFGALQAAMAMPSFSRAPTGKTALCASVPLWFIANPDRSAHFGFESFGLEVLHRGVDELIESAVENLAQSVGRETDAVIRDPPLGKIVGPDLLRPVAGADLAAPFGRPFGIPCGFFDLI